MPAQVRSILNINVISASLELKKQAVKIQAI